MVRKNNLIAIQAILGSDESVKNSSVERVLAVLTGNPEPKEPTLLTQNETAEFLKISRQTIWLMCKKGQLKFVVLPNGLKRFLRKDLETLLEIKEKEVAL